MKKTIKTLILSSIAGLTLAETSLRESFTNLKSNKEVIDLTIEALKTSSPQEVIKEAIIATEADTALIHALINNASAAYPERANIVKLTALAYAPDAFQKFGGAAEPATASENKIIYDIYGTPVARAVKVSAKKYIVYNPEGVRIGELFEEEADGETLNTVQASAKGQRFRLTLDSGINLQFVFGRVPVRGDAQSVAIRLLPDGNVVTERPTNFTADLFEQAGSTTLKQGALTVTADISSGARDAADTLVDGTNSVSEAGSGPGPAESLNTGATITNEALTEFLLDVLEDDELAAAILVDTLGIDEAQDQISEALSSEEAEDLLQAIGAYSSSL